MFIRFSHRKVIFSAAIILMLLFLSVGNLMTPPASAENSTPVQSEPPPTQGYQPTVEPQAVSLPKEPIPAQVIIQFAPDATEKERSAYIESVGGTVLKDIDSLDTVVIAVSEDVAQAPMLESSVIAESEPDYFVSALDFVPDDPRYSEQWASPPLEPLC